jgi:ketosteroid isomerase-like protein
MRGFTGGIAAEAEEFLREIQRRTGSRDADAVAPLIAPDATLWFTEAHRGRDAIVGVIAQTWQTVEDEAYELRDVEVVAQTDTLAVLRYTFCWSARIDGRPASGEGRGTDIVARRDGGWQILHEHLSA